MTKAEGLLASKNFKHAIAVFKEAAASATVAADEELVAHVTERLKDAKDAETRAAEAKNSPKKRGGASGRGARAAGANGGEAASAGACSQGVSRLLPPPPRAARR